MKAQSQAKDTVIRKLKERIKSLSEKDSLEKVKKDINEIETINIELKHSVAKLLSENENLRKEREHLNSIFKSQFDSIGKTSVQSKEYCDSLIAQINAKSLENLDLNAQLQEKVFAITTLKNELRKIKEKNVVNTVVSKPNATLAPGMFKLDIEPIFARLKNNMDAHEVYIDKTIEYAKTLHGSIERTQYPSEPLLESACMFTKHVLVYASQTCPNSPKPSEKLVAVTPRNKDKRVRFVEPVTSPNNIPKQTNSLKTKDSNKPLLNSTGVKPPTSSSGSKPTGNTKNNRISRPPCSNQKNKVEDHHRTVKSGLNKMNSVSEPISNALIKHSMRNAKFESICAICNKCLFDANDDMCLVEFVNHVNVRSKSKSKRNKKSKAWKPTGKMFTNVGYKWKPTGRFFTIVGNSCPLTRITPKKIVHLKETTSKSAKTSKPEIKVYSKIPKQLKSVGSSKKAKIVESKIANNSEPTHLWGSNATDVPYSSSLVNDMFSRSPSGLRHNLFSVGKFCDVDLEVAFRKNTCFIQNLEGVDLLLGSRDTNLYTISLDDMLKTSPVCLLSKALKIKSWLWQHRLSHLNFGTINKLAKDSLARAEDTNQEKLYLLHMDLCGLMRVESINRKKYILAEAINTAYYTQNHSLIRLQYHKTPYEFMHEKPDLSFFQVFGSLFYPTNDNEDLGKLNAKADIGIFVGYASSKKAFRIYNRGTQKIIEIIHMTFDELTVMASKQFGSGLRLQVLTPATSSSGLVPNIIPQQPCNPPKRDGWHTLFQPLFDEYFNPPTIAVSTVPVAAAPRTVEIADSPVSTSIDHDAP
ncbi:integrase, catalytic region, zinc finger, CCHC-type containing protein [Tanacetum coccineum]